MKNLPKIIYVLVAAAALYACNKKDDQEAMTPCGGSQHLDTLSYHDTTYSGNNPVDTTYSGNDPADTIVNGNPVDTTSNQYPVDTTYSGNNPIDSTLIYSDSLSH